MVKFQFLNHLRYEPQKQHLNMTTFGNSPVIVLFRQDLRLNDNPALTYACQTGLPIIPLFILDDETPGQWKMGGASRWWLHHSLQALGKDLNALGSELFIRRGETLGVLKSLIQQHKACAIYWNRNYEPHAIGLEKRISELLPHSRNFKASLLFEPWEIFNKQNQTFKVFTPFWKRCLELESTIDLPLPVPSSIPTYNIHSEPLETLKLLPSPHDWAAGMRKTWKIGEKAARGKLEHFIDHSLGSYHVDRDVPSVDGTSLLSPHLHFGEISPRQIYHATKLLADRHKFVAELGWREFSYYELFHFPDLPEQSWRPEFSRFPWEENPDLLKKWQRGQTGYPIVDAGMRQLWKTGWMHNRVRMIVASFLVKDLFIPWQEGAKWFWDTLVDADLASNSASWQWVAGCGFDAAPFFRIFNPTLQGEKFDPEGVYIKRWVPELAHVPKACIHTPWKMGQDFTFSYVKPIVDHEKARKKALEAFSALRD